MEQERRGFAPEDPGRGVIGGPSRARSGRGGGWPSTSRIRGGGVPRPSPDSRGRCRWPGPEPGRAGQADERGRGPLPQAPQVLAEAGVDADRRRRCRVAGRSHGRGGRPPRRRSTGCARATARRAGSFTWPFETCRLPVRPGAVVSRLDGRIEWRKARRSAARTGRGPQVRLDPVDDRGERHQLARRMQVEQFVDELRRAVHGGEPRLDHRADLVGADVRPEPDQVLGIERRLADLASRRAGRGRPCSGRPGRPPRDAGSRGGPDELLGDEHPAAGRAAGGVQVAERDLQARLAPRRGGHALEGRVEVADVGRPQDDLGQHPCQRVRLERDGPALPVEGRAGDPAATTEQVRDDVAGPGMRLDPGRDEGLRRRREQPIVDRQRRRGLRVRVRRSARHR